MTVLIYKVSFKTIQSIKWRRLIYSGGNHPYPPSFTAYLTPPPVLPIFFSSNWPKRMYLRLPRWLRSLSFWFGATGKKISRPTALVGGRGFSSPHNYTRDYTKRIVLQACTWTSHWHVRGIHVICLKHPINEHLYTEWPVLWFCCCSFSLGSVAIQWICTINVNQHNTFYVKNAPRIGKWTMP